MNYMMAMVFLIGVLAAPGWAQDPGDAPEQGVARISLMSGDVTVRRGDSGEDVAAELNAPLVARDHLFTGNRARAEIQFDYANLLRLAPDSEVRLAELGDRDYLVQVVVGTVNFRVLPDSDGQSEISTPMMSIRPREEGIYRITVADDSSTEITVRSGEAEIYVGGRTDRLREGQTLLVSGDPSDPDRRYRSSKPHDDWDRWNEARDHDRDRDRRDSYRYVNRHVYGAEDLYGHGRWVYDPPYGWVWIPRVSVSWAPYRVGRWVWVSYYGWTWVSGDPWGWAPYHYGRWYHNPRYGWVWYPGDIRVRYYWRPALVAFFGWGSNVGWVALAPNEVYRPWYGPSRTVYVTNVRTVNNINVVNTYRNARFVSGHTGVTSVVAGNFGRQNITVNNYVISKSRDLQFAGDPGRSLPKEPSREHRQFSNRVASARPSSRPDVDRHYVTGPGRKDNSNQGRGGDRPDTPADARNRGNDSPRNDSDRGRQPDNNRGRGENASASRGDARVQPTPASNNANRGNDSRRNEAVVSPRNEQERGRQPDNNRGRGENASASRGDARVQPTPGSNNANRGNDSRRNEAVVFPRNEQERGRQPDNNRGRGENASASPADARVQPTPSSNNANRGNDSRRNEAIAFPRNEQERGRQPDNTRGRSESSSNTDGGRAPENNRGGGRNSEAREAPRNETVISRPSERPQQENRGRNDGFVRTPVESRPESPAETRGRNQGSENSRRPEPVVRSAPAPDNPPARSEPQRSRSEESSRAPQAPPESRSNRPQESDPAPSPSAGGQSRGGPPPQASSSSGEKTEEDESESQSRGRGRDRK